MVVGMSVVVVVEAYGGTLTCSSDLPRITRRLVNGR